MTAFLRQAAPRGRIVTVATDPIDPQGLASAPLFIAVHHDPERLAQLARSVAAGELAVPIGKILRFEQAPEAHRLVERGDTGGKVILIP